MSMTRPLKIGVVGAGGRVGTELLRLIQNSSEMVPSYGIGSRAKGFETNVDDFSLVKSEEINVLIDFSSPAFFDSALAFCFEKGVPLVSGTTGLVESQHRQLEYASQKIPVLWSPNMSLGVAVLKNALRSFAAIRDFDFQVEEWHHRNKKDRPSGTAILLQSELEKVIGKSCPPTMVMRGGGIFGVHKIYGVSDDELLSFEHTAMNRIVFARGALVAARWLSGQGKGLYSIDDVITAKIV